ncbi:3-dehydrosphinganine reductase, partial [Massospora cicadina]
KIRKRHILVVGASQGLGKEVAVQVAALGASRVTLAARGADSDEFGKSRLDYAAEECKAQCSADVAVNTIKMDVRVTESISKALVTLIRQHGMIDWLVVCSGSPLMKKAMMDVNFIGTVNVIRAVLAIGKAMTPSVYPERIVTVGSVASGCPMAGYAAYGASKGALRAFTDVLRNERFFYGNTHIHHFMPGSMDTPGFELENRNKPEVTKLIEGTADLCSASQAATALLQGITNETYLINNDFIGFLARLNIQNLTPRDWPLVEALASPAGILLAEILLRYFDFISKNCAKKSK